MTDILLEKMNVNDDMYLLNEVFYSNGSYVEKDDTIFSIESSKITIEIQAPVSGYLFFATELEDGMELPAGFLIAKILDEPVNPFQTINKPDNQTNIPESKEAAPESVSVERIFTNSARKLMQQEGIREAELTGKTFVSKGDVALIMRQRDIYNNGYRRSTKRIAIIGGGAGAVQVIDLIRSLKDYTSVLIVDDTNEKQGKNLDGIPIIGRVDFSMLKDLYLQGVFDSIINSVSTSIPFRKRCYEQLTALNIPYCNLIHESCVIGSNLQIGTGNILFPFTHIGADTCIGNDNFITAKASIEHHNSLGSHCTFGPGVMTSGHVHIGNECKFGTGIFIEPFVEIGDNSLVASGAILTRSVPENSIVRHQPPIEIVRKR